MKNEEDGEVVCMTEEELRRFVQELVDKDERLVQRREQLAQLEEWIKQKERQAAYNRLLYNNACESVLECESVIKGLYGMLGLEYRDTDSEEEGDVKPSKNVIQISDDFESAEDDGGDTFADGDADDDYVVIDLGAAVPDPTMGTKNESSPAEKSSGSVIPITYPQTLTEVPAPTKSAIMEPSTSENPEPSISVLPVNKTEETSVPISDPSLKDLPANGLIPITENPASTPSPSTTESKCSVPLLKEMPPSPEISTGFLEISNVKTEAVELPVDNTAESSMKLDPSKSPVSSDTSDTPEGLSTNKVTAMDQCANVKPKTPSTSSNTSGKHTENEKSKTCDQSQDGRSSSLNTTPEGEPSDKTKNIDPKQNEKPATSSSSATPTDKNKSTSLVETDKPSSSSSTATVNEKPKSTNHKESDKSSGSSSTATVTEKNKNAHPKQNEKPSGSSSSATTSEKTKNINSKESDNPSSSSVATKAGSTEKSKSTDPKPGEQPSGHSVTQKATNPEKPSSTQNTKAPHLGTDNSATNKDSGTKEGTQVTSAVPARVQQEIKLKENMNVLGRRRTKTWHKGTILDIKTTDGDPRYKVLFEGGKGKSMLSAHHLACVTPPLLKDLFVGCRVVANYKEEDQSWFHAAIIAEMPDRRNRMRFLVFFDDGSAAYMALPDLHLVCKPLRNVCDDMEDEEWKKDMEEYLQAYPNPIFVVMRVGQESKVKREDKMEPCTVTQVDASLIQICYTKDQVKEWLYKGSNRIEQIQRIKKRMAEDKKDQSVNRVGWVPNNRNIKPPTTMPTPSTSVTTDGVSSKAPAPQTVNQNVPTVTSSLKTNANVTTVTTLSTSKPVPSVSTVTVSSTGPTISSVSTVTVSSTGQTVSSASAVSVSSVEQTVSSASTVTTSSSLAIAQTPMYQPKIILNRVKWPPAKEKTISVADVHLESTVTSLSSMKRPYYEQEDQSNQHAIIPVLEPRLKFIPHRCCPACLNQVRPIQKDQHRGKNPLLIPLLYGFRRMTARRRLDGKMSFHVFYRSPCGRSMCDMQEVQDFLFESRCDFLYLDMFSLDPFVLVKRAVLPSSMCSLRYLCLRDISHGKELVPVSCVNEIDSTPPPPQLYTRYRLTAPGVQINTNLDFMVGCDCTDGCRDRSKCACHQLTIEATSLFTGGPVDVSAGYTHKRLPKYVPTGVYECNPLCRCDPWLCGNRLVQHGLQLRLEVFMTQHKGWGIRSLDDIAKGTFVCDFTGRIVTDEMCAEGEASNNEYLANLDYIEGVEKLKEGYESEAYCSDTEAETDKKPLITMTTGALKKHGVFKLDSSSSSDEEKEQLIKAEMGESKISLKRKRKPDDSDFDDSEYEDDLDDEDYEISVEDSAQLKFTSGDYPRSYSTRRNAKMDGPGEPVTSFAKKSTRAFAIKSSHRRVKPLEVGKESVPEKGKMRVRKSTRSLFNGEKGCYLIDAKHEGNLARYINHSCNPNLFVQNVFVDTHDLRFPWVAFFASKRIRAGTELTWDYSYEVGSVEGKVLLCCCGSAECTGRLL